MLDIKLRENKIKTEEPPVVVIEEVKEEKPVQTSHKTEEKDTERLVRVKKINQKRVKQVVMVLIGLSVFFFLTTAYSLYQVYVLKKLAAQDALVHPDVPVTPDQVLDAVAHHMILPEGTPQIATVQDAKKLSTTQSFFKNTQNGDVVLVFETTIVIYRPSKDIIVAVGDISGSQK